MAPHYSEENKNDGRNYGRRNDDDNDRQSSRRHGRQGFASMDPAEQREIASMGGRASHGGRGRNYESDEDNGRGYSSFSRDNNSEEDHERGYSTSSSSGSSRYSDKDNDYEERGSRSNSRRGFAAMDPEEQREIASKGGRASHGGRGRNYESDDNDNERYSSRSSSQDEDQNNDYEDRSSHRRGFAAMDPEEQREIASKGGRASHGGHGRNYESGDNDDRRYSSRSSSQDEDQDNGYEDRSSNHGHSRRGFAAMDSEEQREIASKGGRASHGGHGRSSSGSRSHSHSSRSQ